MSFSYDVKKELVRVHGNMRHCHIAELAALVSGCGIISVRMQRRLFLVIQSENMLVIDRADRLIREAFGVTGEVSVIGNGDWKRGRLYTYAVLENSAAGRILKAMKNLSETGVLRDLEMPVNQVLLQKSCCRRAFIRGAFLACGSITDPDKSYHLEFVFPNEEKAEQLRATIKSFDLDAAKIIRRKKSWVVYVQESNGVASVLGIMEATVAMMNLENVRIVHQMKSKVNRTVNCDTANSQKMAAASALQIQGIEKIQRTIGLDSLPEALRDMALVRLEHPAVPLKDLGEYLEPKVGKSGVNHRLRKLKEIADSL